ncbi:hypothetical protein DSL72_000948 [Monilinia vaccinii-corymbosi]|uniref:Uncharacterized protein n=1 Tax=Monilinia vaccinii-corymbosi TaxID=61207 RepID=A0A8A3P0Q6_9HELO|nr:hypothetical protein DSL72_000948 [Monilinia vaccinii-corymbosi]
MDHALARAWLDYRRRYAEWQLGIWRDHPILNSPSPITRANEDAPLSRLDPSSPSYAATALAAIFQRLRNYLYRQSSLPVNIPQEIFATEEFMQQQACYVALIEELRGALKLDLDLSGWVPTTPDEISRLEQRVSAALCQGREAEGLLMEMRWELQEKIKMWMGVEEAMERRREKEERDAREAKYEKMTSTFKDARVGMEEMRKGLQGLELKHQKMMSINKKIQEENRAMQEETKKTEEGIEETSEEEEDGVQKVDVWKFMSRSA